MKQELIKQLNNFSAAAAQLMEAIYQFDDCGEDVNDYIVKQFPFDRSFDDVVADINVWVETVEEELTK